jgi:phospholipase/carboxylesterase
MSASGIRWGLLACALALTCACDASPSAHTAKAPPGAGAPPGAAPGNTRATELPPLGLGYVEVMTGGAHSADPAPLVIALHGLGDIPERFIGLFGTFPAAARIIAPRAGTRHGDGFSWFPPRGISLDLAAPDIAEAAGTVAAFAEALARRVPTLGKPIVMGFSQGGALSFAIAVRHPSSVSASFPVGAWLPTALWPTARPAHAPPILAFHGTADPRVPISLMRPAVARLEQLGYSIRLQEFEGVEHEIPAVVRAALFEALGAECERQRRGS